MLKKRANCMGGCFTKRGIKWAIAGLACLALTVGFAPVGMSSAEGLQASGLADGESEERAIKIDEMSDSFEDGSIIVVYRENALPFRKADQGLTTQSLSIADAPDVSAELLSADSGTPGGGAAFCVDVPDGLSVGEAVVAAERDPNVLFAQPNFTYYLLDERADATYDAKTDAIDAAESELERVGRAVFAPVDANANGSKAWDSIGQTTGASDADETYALPDDPYVSVSYNDTSDSPSIPNQWWIHAVNAPQAWSLAHGSDNDVAVAVIDTGINFEHEDLKNNILADYAYDACEDEKLTESIDNDEMQHGCHVAGIIAAEANNGKGIAGVSYNAKVLPIRAFHMQYNPMEGMETASCSDEYLIRAYDYLLSDHDGDGRTVAEETNTRVVNMSLGGYLQDYIDEGESPEEAYDYLFEDKIEQAEAAGILTVAAAGNGDGFGNPRTDVSYPSDYPAVMSVIALKTPTTRTKWSDHNAMKNISAPGNNIYSTYWAGNPPYKFESGTSMASPIVAGCAALLWAYDPTLSVCDVKDVLYGTARDLGAEGFDEYYGWGCVDIGAALNSLGTASVSVERPTMVRTSTQQLSAMPIADRSAQHDWIWSVDDPSIARVDDKGMLTALNAGRVTVSATATDDPSIEGHRSVEIVDITLPKAPVASANPQMETISVSWSQAEGACWYKVYRASAASGATSEPGEFSLLGTYPANELVSDTSALFADETAQPSQLYWYRVVPVGELDGLLVDGVGQMTNRCFFTDKKALKAAIDRAEALLSSTAASVDGLDVLATSYWAPADARDALNLALSNAYNAYLSGSMLQGKVDGYNEALVKALSEFEAVRTKGLKKLENTLKASAVAGARSVTYGKQAVFPASELYRIEEAQGAVTYAAASTYSGITVSADGSLSVSKTAPVGQHKITVLVNAAGTSTALPKTERVTVTVQVTKAANGLKVASKAPSVTFSAKGAQVIGAAKAFTVTGAQGALSFAKASGSKAIAVNAKNGAITVAKSTAAGTYKIRVNVKAAGNATHTSKTVSVVVRIVVLKAKNGLSVKAKAPTVSYSAKKARTVSAAKAFSVKSAAGKLSYKKVSGSASLKINAKTGQITVKKGAKRATHALKVKLTAAGTKNYKAASKTVTVKIKVK